MSYFTFSFPNEPEWAVDWQSLSGDNTAQQALLQKELSIANQRLLTLGILGKKLLKEYQEAAAQCSINLQQDEWSALYWPDKNRVEFGKKSFADRDTFFDLATHERYHSAQINKTAICHLAAPDKEALAFAVSPRATLLISTLLERDCQSKTPLLSKTNW